MYKLLIYFKHITEQCSPKTQHQVKHSQTFAPRLSVAAQKPHEKTEHQVLVFLFVSQKTRKKKEKKNQFLVIGEKIVAQNVCNYTKFSQKN